MNRQILKTAVAAVGSVALVAATGLVTAGCSGGGGGGGFIPPSPTTAAPRLTSAPSSNVMTSVTPGAPKTVEIIVTVEMDQNEALTEGMIQFDQNPGNPTQITSGSITKTITSTTAPGITVPGSPGSTGMATYTVKITFAKPGVGGDYKFTMIINGAAGSATTGEFTVALQHDPVITGFSLSPNSATSTLNTTATFTTTDADSATVTKTINWGDGSSVETVAGTTATHTYSSVGNYTATATVTDPDGNVAMTTASATVSSPTPLESPVGLKFELSSSNKILSETDDQSLWISASDWKGLFDKTKVFVNGVSALETQGAGGWMLVPIPRNNTPGSANITFTFSNGAPDVVLPLTYENVNTHPFYVLQNLSLDGTVSEGLEARTSVVNNLVQAMQTTAVGNGDFNSGWCPGEDNEHVWLVMKTDTNDVVAVYHNIFTGVDVQTVPVASGVAILPTISPLRGGTKAVVAYNAGAFMAVCVVDKASAVPGTPLVLSTAGSEINISTKFIPIQTYWWKENTGTQQDYAVLVGPSVAAVIKLADMTYVRDTSLTIPTPQHLFISADPNDHVMRVTVVGNNGTVTQLQGTFLSKVTSSLGFGGVVTVSNDDSALYASEAYTASGVQLIAVSRGNNSFWRVYNVDTTQVAVDSITGLTVAGILSMRSNSQFIVVAHDTGVAGATVRIVSPDDITYPVAPGAGTIAGFQDVAIPGAKVNSLAATSRNVLVDAVHGAADNRIHVINVIPATPTLTTTLSPTANAPSGLRFEAFLATSGQNWRDGP